MEIKRFTVGQLKEIIKDLPDDMDVAAFTGIKWGYNPYIGAQVTPVNRILLESRKYLKEGETAVLISGWGDYSIEQYAVD